MSAQTTPPPRRFRTRLALLLASFALALIPLPYIPLVLAIQRRTSPVLYQVDTQSLIYAQGILFYEDGGRYYERSPYPRYIPLPTRPPLGWFTLVTTPKSFPTRSCWPDLFTSMNILVDPPDFLLNTDFIAALLLSTAVLLIPRKTRPGPLLTSTATAGLFLALKLTIVHLGYDPTDKDLIDILLPSKVDKSDKSLFFSSDGLQVTWVNRKTKTPFVPGYNFPALNLGPITFRTSNPTQASGWELQSEVWPLIFLSISPAALWLLLRTLYYIRRQPLALTVCPHCHYDLRATPTRCPECGYTPTPTLPLLPAGEGGGIPADG